MLRVVTHDEYPTASADNFTLFTHRLDTRSNLHSTCSFHPVRDPSFCRIVRRHFYSNLVSGHDADKVDAHFAGQVAKNDPAIGQFDTKESIR